MSQLQLFTRNYCAPIADSTKCTIDKNKLLYLEPTDIALLLIHFIQATYYDFSNPIILQHTEKLQN